MTLFSAKKTDIDLLARYNFDPKKQEKRVKRIIYTLPGALVIVLIAVIILINLITGISLDNKISNFETKIDMIESDGNDADNLLEKNNVLNQDFKILQKVKDKSSQESSNYSNLNFKLLSDINSSCGAKADLKLMDFSGDSILFTFQTASLNYSDISVIVKNIEELEYFDKVTYTGYQKVLDEAYSFSVVCSFEGGNDESEVAQ